MAKDERGHGSAARAAPRVERNAWTPKVGPSKFTPAQKEANRKQAEKASADQMSWSTRAPARTDAKPKKPRST